MKKYLYSLVFVLLVSIIIGLIFKIENRSKAVSHISAIVELGNREAPKPLNEFATFIEVRREGLDVIYEYLITSDEFPFDEVAYYNHLLSLFIKIMCSNEDIKETTLEDGVKLIHHFKHENASTIKNFVFSIEHCEN